MKKGKHLKTIRTYAVSTDKTVNVIISILKQRGSILFYDTETNKQTKLSLANKHIKN